GAGSIVRVEGREDQVPGEGRLDGDRARLLVPDLTDHDDVRVLPEHTLEPGGEREPGLLVHADLRDAGQLVFHRVLDRQDVLLRAVQLGEDGVERGRFPGAGRAG